MMRRKGVSTFVAALILVAVAVALSAAIAFLVMPNFTQPDQDNLVDNSTIVFWERWEPVDVFNGTDDGYMSCMFKYNTTIFIDCAGNGWLSYENRTHTFVQQIATYDSWTVLKKDR